MNLRVKIDEKGLFIPFGEDFPREYVEKLGELEIFLAPRSIILRPKMVQGLKEAVRGEASSKHKRAALDEVISWNVPFPEWDSLEKEIEGEDMES
jgi:hypothetical protein